MMQFPTQTKKRGRSWWVFLVICFVGQPVNHLVVAQSPQIHMGSPVTGTISTDNPLQLWQYSAQANEQITILVNRLSGDLDPQVRVLDVGGDVVAENDDRLESLVLDSSLEVTFPATASYIIEVGQHSGTGDYRMWLIPGYGRVWEDEDFEENTSRWVNRYAQVESGYLQMGGDIEFAVFSTVTGRVPLNDFYLQADFEWQSDRADSGATTGFVLRVNEDSTRRPPGYYFLITPDGTWQVLIRQNDNFVELQPPTPADNLAQQRVTLGAWLEGDRLRFYANGELLGELKDSTFSQGTWGFQVRGDTAPARVAIDHVLVTVPDTQTPRLPAKINTWRSSQPSEIAGELEKLRLIAVGGERVLTVETQNYEIIPRYTRVFPQGSETDLYVDMLVSVDVRILSGQNIACGLALRSIDEGNQVVAYTDSDGGAGLLETRDGVVERHTYDLLPEIDDPVLPQSNRVLVLLQGDLVTMYVNGTLFTTEFMPPTVGQLGVILLNYATDNPSCRFDNLWVWRWP
ncbi:MAG: hypothetical protein HY862_09165 [Chloroflexi bacterium]|nr:hypothetical protein [Chloroflexota bacterium]